MVLNFTWQFLDDFILEKQIKTFDDMRRSNVSIALIDAKAYPDMDNYEDFEDFIKILTLEDFNFLYIRQYGTIISNHSLYITKCM